jgi:hypothetical protein
MLPVTTQAGTRAMPMHVRLLPLCVALAALPPVVADAAVLNNVLLQWREHAVKCEDPLQPDIEAMTHVAMFEAINAITPKYAPYTKKIDAPAGSSVEAAAASAAHDVLQALCPDQSAVYTGALEAAFGSVEDAAARDAGAEVGRKAAAAVMAARADSGAARKDEMFAPEAAGAYAPTVPRFGTAVAVMRPWVMRTPDELRPAAPPKLDSAVWARDYQEIQRMGGKKSKDRRPEQTDIGKFWAGRDVRIVLPQLVSRPGRTLVDDARFLALAEMAWADSYVSMMDGKYAYMFWRPVTAIRHLVDDGNPDTTADPTWEPLVVTTPPHPEYPCGHCLSAGAVGAVIEAEFGAAAPPIVLQDKEALLRRFDSPRDYIDDVSESRLLAGVHYRFSVDAGRDAGIALGKLAAQRQLRPMDESN